MRDSGTAPLFSAAMPKVKNWLGIEIDAVSWKEKLISLAGGFLALILLVAMSRHDLHSIGSVLLISSMGASAVLLFAMPHGQLSQPWPTIAGHTFAAVIGVTCAKFIPCQSLAAGCAVGLAIGVMHQFKCIHPPGGATALTAVIGGQQIQSLGYSFVWCPVLLNASAMVLMAVAFNYFFAWRRYPASLNRKPAPSMDVPPISHEQVVAALRTLDSFVDITEDDLIALCGILYQNGKIPGETKPDFAVIAGQRALEQSAAPPDSFV
jgi:CBS domain-containing membrane protein